MNNYSLDLPKTPGIYRIVNTATNDFYVGSTINLRKRRSQHFRELRKCTHCNPRLQHAFSKYGETVFLFEILEHVTNEPELISREQYYLDMLAPVYNLLPTAYSRLGSRASEETRRKLSESHKGQTPPTHFVKGHRTWNKGKKASDEARAKMSASQIGRIPPNKSKPMSEAQKAKLSVAKRGQAPPNKGKPMGPEMRAKLSASVKANKANTARLTAMNKQPRSPETIAKMKAAKTGVKHGPPSEETKAKISAAQKGKARPKHTPETKAKMSLAHKGRPGHPVSEETKAKIRLANTGKARHTTPHSPEARAKMSASAKANKERVASLIARNKQGMSPETRAKMKAAKRQKFEEKQKKQNPTLWDTEDSA